MKARERRQAAAWRRKPQGRTIITATATSEELRKTAPKLTDSRREALTTSGMPRPCCRDRMNMATRRRIWPLLGQSSGSWPFAAIALVSAGAGMVGPAFPGAGTVRRLPLSCRGQPWAGTRASACCGVSRWYARGVQVWSGVRGGLLRTDGTGRGVPAGFAEPVVSLRMADGSEVHRLLRDVRARQVITAVPWRAPRSVRGQSHFPGYYWSSTASAHVIFRASLSLPGCWSLISILRWRRSPRSRSGCGCGSAGRCGGMCRTSSWCGPMSPRSW